MDHFAIETSQSTVELWPTLLFYPTPQDPTNRTKSAPGNLEAAIAQLGVRQTKDMKVPGSTSGLSICPLSACEVRRGRRSHSPSSSRAAYKDELPRIRTWNLQLRRPTPYPLGQQAFCSSISGRGQSQSQSKSLELVKVSNYGSAHAQLTSSPPRVATDSESPNVLFAGTALVLEHGGDSAAGSA